MKKNNYQGCILNQTPEQEARNYSQREFVSSPATVNWTEKKQENWNRYPIRNQDGSSSCVAMTMSKELSIIFQQKYGKYIEFSSAFTYQNRNNLASLGCTSIDLYSVFPKLGNIYESFMPSQNMSESQIMAVKEESWFKDLAKVHSIKRIALPLDFETVASTVQQTGKGVMIWVSFSASEWTNIPKVSNKPITSGHSICVTDYTLVDGKKYLVVDDSWGLNQAMNGQRLISEEYFSARCFLASYLMAFTLGEQKLIDRPSYDGTIISLQKCLQFDGVFPMNVPFYEGIGAITTSAIIKFQKKYNINPPLGYFGSLTTAKIIELFP